MVALKCDNNYRKPFLKQYKKKIKYFYPICFRGIICPKKEPDEVVRIPSGKLAGENRNGDKKVAVKEKQADGMSMINSHIENNSFSRVYLMGGDEAYLVRQYKDKLIDALCDRNDSMNYMAYKGEKAVAEDIREFAMTMPFC